MSSTVQKKEESNPLLLVLRKLTGPKILLPGIQSDTKTSAHTETMLPFSSYNVHLQQYPFRFFEDTLRMSLPSLSWRDNPAKFEVIIRSFATLNSHIRQFQDVLVRVKWGFAWQVD